MSIDRKQLTENQKNMARSIEAVYELLDNWDKEDVRARAKVSDSTKSLSSFVIEELLSAAGTEAPRREARAFLRKVEERGGVVFDEYLTLDVVTDWDATEVTIMKFREWLQDKILRWFKPNSTSNASVEIELNEHQSWVSLYGAATGKNFF